jgi:hypothetical protein
MRNIAFMIRLFLADVPDAIATKLAWLLPRRVAYWAAVRVISHAAAASPTTEMNAITPADALKLWSVR